jgi:Tol biopolymer transport system component
VKWLTCAAALLVALPAPASASFPGRNGDLAVASPFGDVRHIVEIDPRTGDKDWLTQPIRGFRGRDTYAPRYFPDGRRFLFVRHGVGHRPSLWSAAKEGGDAVVHAGDDHLPRGTNLATASFSPDGERVVYDRFGGVFTARLDGSEERELRRERRCTRPDGTVDPPECDFTINPVWSPDGLWIAVERTGGAVSAAQSGLWLMRASDGGLVRRLARSGYEVDWSPDSRRVVFANAESEGAAPGDLYSVRIDGSGLRRLTRGAHTNDVAPAWSPDGKWLAWVRIGFDGNPVEDADVLLSVWRKRIGGGPAEKIADLPEPPTDDGFFEPPTLSWQPRPRR